MCLGFDEFSHGSVLSIVDDYDLDVLKGLLVETLKEPLNVW